MVLYLCWIQSGGLRGSLVCEWRSSVQFRRVQLEMPARDLSQSVELTVGDKVPELSERTTKTRHEKLQRGGDV